jgi:hypothetical protein
LIIINVKKVGLLLFFGNKKTFNVGININYRTTIHHNHKPWYFQHEDIMDFYVIMFRLLILVCHSRWCALHPNIMGNTDVAWFCLILPIGHWGGQKWLQDKFLTTMMRMSSADNKDHGKENNGNNNGSDTCGKYSDSNGINDDDNTVDYDDDGIDHDKAGNNNRIMVGSQQMSGLWWAQHATINCWWQLGGEEEGERDEFIAGQQRRGHGGYDFMETFELLKINSKPTIHPPWSRKRTTA